MTKAQKKALLQNVKRVETQIISTQGNLKALIDRVEESAPDVANQLRHAAHSLAQASTSAQQAYRVGEERL